MVKMLLDTWLETFGFESNPFASREAGGERRLNEYFVTPPYFDEILGQSDTPRTALIFAPRGGGKTAQRVMVDYHCKRALTRGKILSVLYIEFTPVVEAAEGDFSRITARLHAEEILKRTIKALADFIAEDPIALKMFRQMSDSERVYLRWFVSAYADYLSPQQVTALDKGGVKLLTLEPRGRLGFRCGDDEVISTGMMQLLAAKKESPPADLLGDLAELICSLGVNALYILVDRVDEFMGTAADLTAAVALIEPLVADLTLMNLQKVAFKFFLPLEMEDMIRARATVRQDRLLLRRIEWTDKALLEVLHKRLEAFSHYSSLDAVCVPELRGRIEQEMLQVANGSPRNLIRLGDFLLLEHCRSPMPKTEQEWLITEEAWEAAKERFTAEPLVEWLGGKLEERAAVPERETEPGKVPLSWVAADFPAPIALVCRDFLNQLAPQRRLKRLLDLFEVTVTFSLFILVCQYATQMPQEESKTLKRVLGLVLDRISPGAAVGAIGRFSGALTGRGKSYYGRHFQRFYSRNCDSLNAFLELRNMYAHGALQNGESYTEIVEERIGELDNLFKELEFLTQTMFIRVENLKSIEGRFVHQARLYMGDNPNFPWKKVTLPVPLECDKLLLINGEVALLLHPFIVEERCEECGSKEIFFYNRLTQENVSYLSYNCGHRFETSRYRDGLATLLGA